MGSDNAHLALSLVGYDAEVAKAIEYVFGTTIVCDAMESAKKVTFFVQLLPTYFFVPSIRCFSNVIDICSLYLWW